MVFGLGSGLLGCFEKECGQVGIDEIMMGNCLHVDEASLFNPPECYRPRVLWLATCSAAWLPSITNPSTTPEGPGPAPPTDTKRELTEISRADECRLLYLTQAEFHTGPPLTPCAPFGVTALVDCSLEAQEHVLLCRGKHGLVYSGWEWDCREDFHSPESEADGTDGHGSGGVIDDDPGHEPGLMPQTRQEVDGDDVQIQVDYSALDRESDASQDLTYNIFMWLRGTDGFPAAERAIREHEWFNYIYDSNEDDENVSPEGDGRFTAARRGGLNVGT